MSWVVQDSDEEGGISDHPKRTARTLSSISEFNPFEIPLATEDKSSTISEFTAGNSTKPADTTSDTIADASVVVAKPKPKRPKPRPAYGKVLPLDKSLVGIDFSFASMTAEVINQMSWGSPYGAVQGVNSSLDSSNRESAHKRSATTRDVNGKSSRSRVHDNIIHSDSVMEGLSKTFTRPGSGESGAILHIPDTDEAHTPSEHEAHQPSSSSHALRSPGMRLESNSFGGTPPSSPLKPRKRKRQIIELDSDLDDSIEAFGDVSVRTNAKDKKEKKTKEKIPREKKTKARKEDGDESIVAKSSKKATKRNSKARDKALEPEFKSKEYIEDSDDELLLEPETSRSVLRASHSAPASADASVDASVDISIDPSGFGQTTTAVASCTVLPSPSATAQSFAAVSGLPPADISAPPPSPSGLVALPSDESIIKRKKKRTNVSRTGEQDGPEETGLIQRSSGQDAIEKHNTGKDERRAREGKPVEPLVSLLESDERYAAEPSESAEQDVSEAKGSRKKRRKKPAAIVSSEEGPEIVATYGEPDEMEGGKTKSTQDRISDKENEPVNPPNVRLEKVSESVTPGEPAAQRQTTNSKAQATPKSSSRRDSMSAIIRRVSAKMQSPLCSPSPVYSPLAKASRTTLGRIAPLHPNRRTPPPPPPRPPAPKKSKKMLELEEKWEEELAESVDGWACMTDEERAALRRAKRDEYLGFED